MKTRIEARRPQGIVSVYLLILVFMLGCGGGGSPADPADPGDPGNPGPKVYTVKFISDIDTTCSEDVALYKDYLYIADGPSGVRVIDVSTPSDPVEVKIIASEFAQRVYPHSDYLYLCDTSGGLKIFSLANPGNPTLVYSEDIGYADSISFRENRMYVGNYYGGLRAYNRDNPASPVLINNFSGNRVRDIYFLDNRLLVSDNPYGINIYTEETPGILSFKFQKSGVNGNFEDIVGYKTCALLSRNDEMPGIQIFDIYFPATSPVINVLTPSDFIEGISISGNFLLAACGEDGIFAYDLDKLPSPPIIWKADTPGYTRRVKKYGDMVYVADMDSVGIYKVTVTGGGS